MKKLMSLILVLAVVLSLSATSFAATGNSEYLKMSGVTNSYTDNKTGLSFTAPEEWIVQYSNVKHGAVGNGTSYTSRQIDVYSGIGQIQICQVGKSKSFVVNVKHSDLIYYVDPTGVTILNGSYPLAGTDDSDWGLQQKAVDQFIESIHLVVFGNQAKQPQRNSAAFSLPKNSVFIR